MGQAEILWTLLKHSPDPSLRSYLVHRLGPLGVDPGLLIARLDREADVSIRRALILSLGEYAEGRLSTTERDAWVKKLLDLYRSDPDPGVHGATDWLLRQWRNENQLKEIDRELRKLPLPALEAEQRAGTAQENNRGWYVNSQGQTMVIVRCPVEFEMGEGVDLHRVRVGRSFAIATKAITVEQFQRFLQENPRVRVENYGNFSPEPTCPMNSVSWYDATSFCNWLSKKDGIPEDQWCYAPNEKGDFAEGMKVLSNPDKRTGYRLPTEAEWEYSCRAVTVTGYSFGEPWDFLLEKYAWYVKNSPSRSQPVGALKPNDLGLFDLHGNLWEWCQDTYTPDREYIHTHIKLTVYDQVPRILRGGSFFNPPALVRSAYRFWNAPAYRSLNCVRPSRTYH
jgi:formylglycine-generating enzyme required for sulfatase activity